MRMRKSGAGLGLLLSLVTPALVTPALAQDMVGVDWNGGLYRYESRGGEPPVLVSDDLPFSTNCSAKTRDGRLFAATSFIPNQFLYEIDETTGAWTHVLATGFDARGLAWSATEQVFYAIADGGDSITNDRLKRIDPAKGTLTDVGELDDVRYQGLAMASDGTLYAWALALGLRIIDTTDGSVSDPWKAGGQSVDGQYLLFAPDGRLLVGRWLLFEVDLGTGTVTGLANLDSGFDTDPRGMEFRRGVGDVIGESFCDPAQTNSTGLPGRLTVTGVDEAGGWYLDLAASDLPQDRFGWFVAGLTQGMSTPPGSQGDFCLGDPWIGWGSMLVQNSGPAGAFDLVVDTLQFPTDPPRAVLPGETWHFQAWYRDENPGHTTNFTNGISVTFR